MHQKDFVRAAWTAAGLYDEQDAKLQQFLVRLEDPTQCWPELIGVCRREYSSYKARLAQPILDAKDALVHLALIRAASEPDELALLEKYVAASDPASDETELKAIALKNVAALNRALAERADLPASVQAILDSQVAAELASVTVEPDPSAPLELDPGPSPNPGPAASAAAKPAASDEAAT
jgi:hypothetical protein